MKKSNKKFGVAGVIVAVMLTSVAAAAVTITLSDRQSNISGLTSSIAQNITDTNAVFDNIFTNDAALDAKISANAGAIDTVDSRVNDANLRIDTIAANQADPTAPAAPAQDISGIAQNAENIDALVLEANASQLNLEQLSTSLDSLVAHIEGLDVYVVTATSDGT